MDAPQGFKLIDVPLPPMLLDMAGVKGESRYVSLYYWGSKATWNDGRSSATFPFYTVWLPYIEHLAIAIHLFDYHLGADDEYPTHVLVCDRLEQKVLIALIEEAKQFLESQHPPRQSITPEQLEQIKELVAQQEPLNISEMQNLGMFELFTAPKPEHKQRAAQLIQWLDEYIDEALIKKYIDVAKAGNYQAIFALSAFKSRCR